MLWLAASLAPVAEAPGEAVASAGCATPAPVSPVEDPASVPDVEAWPAVAPVLAALVVSAVDPAADVLVAAPVPAVSEDEDVAGSGGFSPRAGARSAGGFPARVRGARARFDAG